jgi:hypothetical protein
MEGYLDYGVRDLHDWVHVLRRKSYCRGCLAYLLSAGLDFFDAFTMETKREIIVPNEQEKRTISN